MRLSSPVAIGLLTVLGMALIGVTLSTPAKSAAEPKFENFLVVGIAGDYQNRSQFERVLVSQLRKKGAAASTYHSVVGGNKAVTKEDVIAAIQEHGFDAVLAIRRLDGDIEMKVTKSRTETEASTMASGFVNLFRSDYTDYTTPGSIDLATKTMIAIELYNAKTQEIVYQFDYETKRETNIGLLIDRTAETIAKRLDRQGLVGD